MAVRQKKTASKTYARIYSVVKKIPRGKVATYGQVATLAGMPRHARQVGYALHTLAEDSGVPWQRVINAQGEISRRTWSENHLLQRILLEDEGVEFNAQGRVSLARFGWTPQR
jgi:methylated-DNA-protein-cysteine methyltransferase related protein